MVGGERQRMARNGPIYFISKTEIIFNLGWDKETNFFLQITVFMAFHIP